MWLLKTEPSAYGYDDLEREGRAVWDGVSNPAALARLRAVKVGERAVIYHTGDEKAAVGIAQVTRAAYPDPRQKDPRLVVIELEPVRRLRRSVPLSEIKAHAAFADSPLLRQGRLSVVPLTREQWQVLEGAR